MCGIVGFIDIQRSCDNAEQLIDNSGIFNPQFVQGLLKAHASTKLVNYSEAIFALLSLELWFETYIDQPSFSLA